MANRRSTTVEDPARDDRAMTDRQATESRDLTEDERLAMFRSSFHQAALPDLPKIDGYHVVWLSKDSRADPIHKRINLGYVPLTPADVPGWEMADAFVGKWQDKDAIVWNEMVGFKIPMDLYDLYARESHENRPNAMESGIVGQISDAHASGQRGDTSIVTDGDGFKQLGRSRPRGDFKRRDLEPGFQRRRY